MLNGVPEIENAVKQLSAEELAAFRAWFTKFDAGLWDRQIEEDSATGKLDRLAEGALQGFRDGRYTNL